MILKLEDGTEVELRFTHYQNAHPPHTEVKLSSPSFFHHSGYLLGGGYCHPSDQFNKSIGRKVALARAIKTLPRGMRTQIWKAYFDFVNGAGK